MDKSKSSQQRRNRNRKPDDPSPQHLARVQGNDPSVSRNAKRAEPWRGDNVRGKHSGRRGRKWCKQDQKVRKQQRLNKRERKIELDKRIVVARTVADWVGKLCTRSEVGIIVPRSIKGRFPREMQFTKYCPTGLVKSAVIRLDTVYIVTVQPWIEMSSSHLESIKRRHWKPFWPKNILQIIADELGPG